MSGFWQIGAGECADFDDVFHDCAFCHDIIVADGILVAVDFIIPH
ncbi:hypothetical protein [Rahnella bruchi]|nr:hypothetical protein [Rahnella bruchi]